MLGTDAANGNPVRIYRVSGREWAKLLQRQTQQYIDNYYRSDTSQPHRNAFQCFLSAKLGRTNFVRWQLFRLLCYAISSENLAYNAIGIEGEKSPVDCEDEPLLWHIHKLVTPFNQFPAIFNLPIATLRSYYFS